ncbi:MAG TPA: YceI family protein [Acidimicrobiales bacterium]|jgi:polyisoprenoid-binding protein YceI|nr:YceI family protein [Acidimicrobiales bacterium]
MTTTRDAQPAQQTKAYEGLTVPTPAAFAIDSAHSEIGFGVKHMMVSKVRGRFGKYDGRIEVADDLLSSQIELSVDMDSIDTREETRDNHLRSDDFFSSATHPKMTFKSTAIRHRGGDKFEVTGDLTIKGVTKPITLDVTYEGVVSDPYGNQRIGFSARGELDRYDYGVSFGAALEAGGLVVAKKVSLEFEIEAVRAA